MAETLEQNPGYDLVYADAINFGDRSTEGETTMESNPSEGLATFESLVLEKCSVVGFDGGCATTSTYRCRLV